jgi:hypothetical protein
MDADGGDLPGESAGDVAILKRRSGALRRWRRLAGRLFGGLPAAMTRDRVIAAGTPFEKIHNEIIELEWFWQACVQCRVCHAGVAATTHHQLIQLAEPTNRFAYRNGEGIVSRDGGGLLDRPVSRCFAEVPRVMRVCPMARSG